MLLNGKAEACQSVVKLSSSLLALLWPTLPGLLCRPLLASAARSLGGVLLIFNTQLSLLILVISLYMTFLALVLSSPLPADLYLFPDSSKISSHPWSSDIASWIVIALSLCMISNGM